MPVLMLVAAVVILAGVVVVASGRGGEMAVTGPDYPPIDLGPVTAADVALLRPPSAAWGYNMRVTDEALEVIAKAVTERDVEIAALQQEVSDLRDQLGGDGRTAALEPAADRDRPERTELETPETPGTPGTPGPAWPSDAETTVTGAGAAITRPQPIYRDPGADGAVADPGAPGGHGDLSTPSQPGAPDSPLAPWEPAPPPPGQVSPWDPSHPPTAEHAISWEAPSPATGEQATPWDAFHPATGEQPGPWAPPADEPPASEPDPSQPAPGWSPDPADTSPDATAQAASEGQTSLPVTPATGWRAPTAPAPTASSAPAAPAGSVWDVASRQVDQAQGQAQGQNQAQNQRQARAAGAHEFNWDKDPHERLVWGAANARAKSAQAAEETQPHGEQPEDDRD